MRTALIFIAALALSAFAAGSPDEHTPIEVEALLVGREFVGRAPHGLAESRMHLTSGSRARAVSLPPPPAPAKPKSRLTTCYFGENY